MTPISRTSVLILGLCATTACQDSTVPTAPESAPMSAQQTPSLGLTADVSDLDDLLSRVIPAMGENTPAAHAQLQGLSQQIELLRDATVRGDSKAMERHQALAMAALDRLDRDDDPMLAADRGVLRLVLEQAN